jgi:hypothetical protein
MPDAPTLATTPTSSATAAPAPSAAPAPRAAPQSPAPSQRVTPNTPEWAALTTEQRHAALKGPANPRAVGYSPARDQREAAAARAAGEAPQGDAPAGDQPTPAAAQGEKVRVGEYEISPEELGAMMQRQAVEDGRRLTLPLTPTDYRAELPEGLTLPGGQTYTFNPADPSLVAARNLAHSKGWSQQDFSEALGIFASHIAGEQAALAERSAAEVAKAGANAPQRVDAVTRWITAEVGEADAKPIRATIVTDAHLRFYERLMNKITSQGTASFSSAHRVPPETNNGIPGFDKMSFEQRRQAQDTLAARRR